MNSMHSTTRFLAYVALGSGLALAAGRAANADTLLDRALREEAQQGNRIRVTELVQAGADINSQAPYGETALYYATLFGRAAAALRLLELGAAADIATEDGRTPLLRAAESCDTRLVEALLKRGAEISQRDRQGTTPLLEAVESNCVRTVAMLLSHARRLGRARFLDIVDARDNTFRGAADYVHHPWIEAMFRLAHGERVDAAELPPGVGVGRRDVIVKLPKE